MQHTTTRPSHRTIRFTHGSRQGYIVGCLKRADFCVSKEASLIREYIPPYVLKPFIVTESMPGVPSHFFLNAPYSVSVSFIFIIRIVMCGFFSPSSVFRLH